MSRGLGDVYKRQAMADAVIEANQGEIMTDAEAEEAVEEEAEA